MKLINGDCLEYLKTLPDHSIDAIITDPPYGIAFLSARTDNHHEIKNDGETFEPTMRTFFQEAKRIVKCEGVVVCCCGGGGAFSSLAKMTMLGLEKFDLYNTIIWSKGKTDGSFVGLGWSYRPSWEGAIVFCTKGKHKFKRDPQSNVFVCKPHIPKKGEHPTQKPLELMEFFVRNHTLEGEIILDPFMGSGTTGIAALKNGRDFIGIEIDEGYYNLATLRCSKWENQTSLKGLL